MYVYIENETAINITPDFDSNFPNVPVTERYSEEYLAKCEHFSDTANIKSGMVRTNGVWSYPPVKAEPTPEPEPIPASDTARLEQELAETKQELEETQSELIVTKEQVEVLTECVLEMSEIIYAE